MRSKDLVSSFGEIAQAKDIDRDTLQIIVEDVIRAMIEKRYGSDEAFEIIFNPNQGDIQILHIQEIVDNWDLEDPVTQIELDDAQALDEDFEVGDEVASEMNITDFGRRAVMTARQTFRQRIRDIEKEHIHEEYSQLIGEIIVGEIYQTRRYETLLMHEGVEISLPRDEQIPGESRSYRKGNMLRVVIKEVRRDAGSDPQVIASRTAEVFMERLFEIEVPEVYDGIVEIKKIARIPGDRAKVAVTSHDDRVDPVGACVGVKGVRIHAVVRELANENIDVLEWSDNPHVLISRALSPANPTSIKLNERAVPPRARAEVLADEVSQAIGRGGVNIKLASQLTGYEIDVFREIPADEEDIDIEEFGDELSEETIGKLKRIGCDTGKAVLELSADALARRAGLDRETAERVLTIIETEFDKGPGVIESIEQGYFTVESPRGGVSADGAASEATDEPANAENAEADVADAVEVEEDAVDGAVAEEVVTDDPEPASDTEPQDEALTDEESTNQEDDLDEDETIADTIVSNADEGEEEAADAVADEPVSETVDDPSAQMTADDGDISSSVKEEPEVKR